MEISFYQLKEYTTPQKSAKELFKKNYKLLKNEDLFPLKETIHYTIIQLQNTIKESPNIPEYRKDYLWDMIKEVKLNNQNFI